MSLALWWVDAGGPGPRGREDRDEGTVTQVELCSDRLDVGRQEDVRLAGALVTGLRHAGGAVVFDELLADRDTARKSTSRGPARIYRTSARFTPRSVSWAGF